METENFNITNEERKRQGLQPLACDPIATKTAREYSAWMCRDGFFSHTGPDGSSPATRLRSNGASFMGAGENIAAGASSAQQVHTGWMNSPGHRANILRTSFLRLGVGYVACPGGRYRHYWTQNFLW